MLESKVLVVDTFFDPFKLETYCFCLYVFFSYPCLGFYGNQDTGNTSIAFSVLVKCTKCSNLFPYLTTNNQLFKTCAAAANQADQLIADRDGKTVMRSLKVVQIGLLMLMIRRLNKGVFQQQVLF